MLQYIEALQYIETLNILKHFNLFSAQYIEAYQYIANCFPPEIMNHQYRSTAFLLVKLFFHFGLCLFTQKSLVTNRFFPRLVVLPFLSGFGLWSHAQKSLHCSSPRRAALFFRLNLVYRRHSTPCFCLSHVFWKNRITWAFVMKGPYSGADLAKIMRGKDPFCLRLSQYH